MTKYNEKPAEFEITKYRGAFKLDYLKPEKIEYAWFIETAYLVIDDKTNEVESTEPLLHSLN